MLLLFLLTILTGIPASTISTTLVTSLPVCRKSEARDKGWINFYEGKDKYYTLTYIKKDVDICQKKFLASINQDLFGNEDVLQLNFAVGSKFDIVQYGIVT